MVISGIDQRESKVMDFINNRNKEISQSKAMDAINASPDVKLRKLDSECKKGKSICIDAIIARVYKDALPFDDPKKNSCDAAMTDVKDFIHRRCGRDSEYYVKEAIKKTNSSVLKGILTEAEEMTKRFYREKAKDIGTINISDLNFNLNADDEGISKITKKLELDEISTIIHDNVQKAIQDEAEKTKREDEYNKAIEDKLAADTSVTDDTSMESALEKLQPINHPRVYQPSLFEAVMIKYAGSVTESVTGSEFVNAAIEEYTLLNVSKALRLENFTVESVRKLANEYSVA